MESIPYNLRSAVLGIGGSPRRGGNSDVLLRHILSGVEQAGLETTTVHLREYRFDPCVGCEQCRKDKCCTRLHDGMQLIYPRVIASRGIVLVCPTHNYNVTAWIKAFIDRLYCFYEFEDTRPRAWSSRLAGQGRKAVLCAVCEQPDKKDMGYTLEAMRMPLEALGYEIAGELPVYGIFDRGLVKKERGILERAEALGKTLAGKIADIPGRHP